MAIAQRQNKYRKGMRFLERFFPPKMRERVCFECGRPLLEHPERVPTARFARGNVEVFVFSSRTFMREVFVVRVGVWRMGADAFQLGQLMASQDMLDLQLILTEAIEFVISCEEKAKEKTVVEMSLRRSKTKNEKEEYGTRE